MILFFNNQPVSLDAKIDLELQNAKSILGSDYEANLNKFWFGDNLPIESLFPRWIVKQYTENPNSVTIVPLIKQYFRWLFSQDYGYGAQLNWENIRNPLLMHDIFLEAYADFYFPGADFGSAPLNNIIQNLRPFMVKYDTNYLNYKGTETGIKYAISTLFEIPWDSVIVKSGTYNIIEVKVTSTYSSTIETYKSFFERYIVPAGVSVKYSTF